MKLKFQVYLSLTDIWSDKDDLLSFSIYMGTYFPNSTFWKVSILLLNGVEIEQIQNLL